jgi:hypothetical protein
MSIIASYKTGKVYHWMAQHSFGRRRSGALHLSPNELEYEIVMERLFDPIP